MSSNPFIGQVIQFAGNFAPRGWALCQGQLLAITSNSALFSILGTTYGGDGRTTFGLPDLRGRSPIGAGNGPGLSSIRLGQRGGSESVSLNTTHLPSHNHLVTTTMDQDPGTTSTPDGSVVPAETSEDNYGPGTNPVSTTVTTAATGGSQPVPVRDPYLATNYIIALYGTYPSRS